MEEAELTGILENWYRTQLTNKEFILHGQLMSDSKNVFLMNIGFKHPAS